MTERFRQLPVVRAFDRTDALLFVLAALALGFAVGPISEVLNTMGSFGLGTTLSLLVSRYYSKRDAAELRGVADALRKEIDRLRDHTTLILRGLYEAGLVDYRLDEQGVPHGIPIERRVTDAACAADSTDAKLESRPEDESTPPEQE